DALPVVDWAPTETPRRLQVLRMIASVWLVLIFAIPSSAEAACPPGQDLRTDRSSNGQVKARGCVGRGADGNYRRQGPWTFWYENGQKKAEGAFKDDKKEGPWTYWHVNGQKESEGAYKNGKREGPWTAWYENGQKMAEGAYKDGKREGRWTYWYANGQKGAEGAYKDGRRECGRNWW